jgi:hypothetical protein
MYMSKAIAENQTSTRHSNPKIDANLTNHYSARIAAKAKQSYSVLLYHAAGKEKKMTGEPPASIPVP